MLIDILIANVKETTHRCRDFETENGIYHIIYSQLFEDFNFIEDSTIETVAEKDGYILQTFKDRGDECLFVLPNGSKFFVTIHDNRLLQLPHKKG